ncbi:hypothetical protein HanRHA438_Chr13g0593331 [Helianthus annuus]|uniref:Uncharacterized protein n=1 Tax=Helianthus annuus TaxID=4232 RepID=A0A9K3HAG2_HELAN|nr:hypothetical protein HanXRQr2_Chr13g0582631 [Helianthus annuus]KAJ0476462.1 hypothetical protein HanHA300_Chr13g0477671 [Helianthus annuus]KAJ0480664.1 hypothetical protein HanIR_Chr13g0634241 [Helianthus annuus]KAJ0497289.1 hypothetical protein HanHA89_Chr13g0509781 [Helianthus annuus]KAJ0663298.1 hypothetical protein HanLR1_Chr13g0479731 [Helianthus annuus]
MKFNRFNVLSTRFVIFDCWWKTVEVLGSHSCPSGGGASIEEDGDGGGGLKRNYDGDMGSFRVLSNGDLVMVVVQGTGRRRLGFHHYKTLEKSSDLESQKSSHPGFF